jgi:hypothetical protein
MDAGELLLGSSSDSDQETAFGPNCTSSPCRWGDYSGATPDPVNPGVVWGSNQLIGPVFPLGLGFAQWTTQNFAVITLQADNRISGMVKDASGAAVAGASVQAYLGGAGAVCCTFVSSGASDSSGNYSFALSAGTYKIWINPPSPFPQQWNGGTDFASATVVIVSGPTVVNITLQADNRISGMVKDASGVAVAGASVQAYLGGAGAVCCTFVSSGASDSSGNYSFALSAGTYKIWINPPSPFPQQWNGGTDFASAAVVIVSGPTLVNITLHS